MSNVARVYITFMNLIILIVVVSVIGLGAYFYQQGRAENARREELQRGVQAERDKRRFEANERAEAKKREYEATERKARLEEERVRAEAAAQRAKADADRKKQAAEASAKAALERARIAAEDAEKQRIADEERRKGEAEQEKIRLQLDADAKKREIETADASLKVARKDLAVAEEKVTELDKAVKAFGVRIANAQTTMKRHYQAWYDWDRGHKRVAQQGGVVVVQDNSEQMEQEAKKYIAAKEESERLTTLNEKAVLDLATARKDFDDATARITLYSTRLTDLGAAVPAAGLAMPPKVPAAGTVAAAKTYVLKDGRTLKVVKAVDFGNDLSLKLEGGDVIAVPKAEVVEIK
ncbi:MAG: hypothetical protein HS116_03925 [Planctomycetes bacterium]|nr:hypothetical protein [Planctomycetota bacterium]